MNKNIIYGIWVTEESYDIFEDGSRKRTGINEGWHNDTQYNSMKDAKISLAMVKDMLNEDWYDVTEVNTVTLNGVRECNYHGEPFAPVKHEKHVVYHIEKIS